MKRIFLMTIAAIAALASCQKENGNVDPQPEDLVFTATIIASDTKTTIDADKTSANKGKIYWVNGDEITVTDSKSKSAVYVAQSGGETTTTFKIKSGETALGEGPYTATYGTAPSTSQNYSDWYSAEKQAKNLYMTAPSTPTKDFTFTAACGLLKLNLTSSDASDKNISEIKVFGKVGGKDAIYTLTCSSAQSTSSAKDFFIALPAGSYTAFKFTNSSDHICYKTAKNAIAISDNAIQPVTLTGIEFNDMLPGKFSVSASQKVRFSKGNLQATCTTAGAEGTSTYSWGFAKNQYDYVGNKAGNTTIGNQSVGNVVDIFGWVGASSTKLTGAATKYGISNSGTTTDYGNVAGEDLMADWGTTIDNEGTWRTLTGNTNGEWWYLVSSRSVNGGTGEGKTCLKATINSDATDVYGLIIYPDGYTAQSASTSYTSAEWAVMEFSGCVFLPAAGNRISGIFYSVGTCCYYWSSKSNETLSTEACSLISRSDKFKPDGNTSSRHCAFSVRLVADI